MSFKSCSVFMPPLSVLHPADIHAFRIFAIEKTKKAQSRNVSIFPQRIHAVAFSAVLQRYLFCCCLFMPVLPSSFFPIFAVSGSLVLQICDKSAYSKLTAVYPLHLTAERSIVFLCSLFTHFKKKVTEKPSSSHIVVCPYLEAFMRKCWNMG